MHLGIDYTVHIMCTPHGILLEQMKDISGHDEQKSPEMQQ